MFQNFSHITCDGLDSKQNNANLPRLLAPVGWKKSFLSGTNTCSHVIDTCCHVTDEYCHVHGGYCPVESHVVWSVPSGQEVCRVFLAFSGVNDPSLQNILLLKYATNCIQEI